VMRAILFVADVIKLFVGLAYEAAMEVRHG
jgi:hypothetical protein